MKVEDPEQALTEAVCSRVREQLGGADAELAEAFARQFYRWVAPEDVAERDPLDLYGLALGTFNFARERAARRRRRCASTTRTSRSTAGSPPTRPSRS